MPMKLAEPTVMKRAAAPMFARPRSSEKKSARTMSSRVVWIRPYTTAYRADPSNCTERRTGAIIVYSSVPSHRSQVIVSPIDWKTTER